MTGTGTRWYRGLGPVTVPLACQGQRHRISWRAGRLILEDHDVAAEAALVALGATPCPCLLVLSAWKALRRRPGLGPLWDLDAVFGVRPTWRVATAQLVAPPELPPELRPVAALAAVVAAERRWADPALPDEDRRRLAHFLACRVREAVEQSLVTVRLFRPGVEIVVACGVSDPTREMTIVMTGGGSSHHLRIRLPLSWLVDVWHPGLACIDDLVVFEAHPGAAPGAVDVTGLRWDLRGMYGVDARLICARLRPGPGGGWRIEERPDQPVAAQLVGA